MQSTHRYDVVYVDRYNVDYADRYDVVYADKYNADFVDRYDVVYADGYEAQSMQTGMMEGTLTSVTSPMFTGKSRLCGQV